MNNHETREQPTPKPSVLLLVSVHTILLLGRCTFHALLNQNSLSLLLGFILFSILFGISSVIHLLIYYATRKRHLKNVFRIPLYFLPLLFVMSLSFVLPPRPQKVNQTSPLVSSNQQYVMKMHIKKDRWRISVFDLEGHKMYEDIHSDFVGHLNVYWIWDLEDRLWLYNSDDGYVYYWTLTSEGWQKVRWGYGHTRLGKEDLKPPEDLYPL